MDTSGGSGLSGRRQLGLIALLSANFGIVFFDRNGINFLMPFIQSDLKLNNFQIGLIASGTSFTWALAAFSMGILSDRLGSRKTLLVCSTLAFSLCSWCSGLTHIFATLFAIRLLMGLMEGGVLPISHALVAGQVSSRWRGLAQGVTQNLGANLFGSFLAPILLVAIASAYGWRASFFVSGLPGLVTALLMWWAIGEPTAERGPAQESLRGAATAAQAILNRNVMICALISILLSAYLVTGFVFLPLFLSKIRGYAPSEMALLIGLQGLSAAVGSFCIPSLSDRFGRRPVMVLAPLAGVVVPLAAIFYSGPTYVLAMIFCLGWGCVVSTFSLFMATVPSESVEPARAATVCGFCIGAGEIFGGVCTPVLAGAGADSFGLTVPLWIMAAATILAGALAIGLRETGPRCAAQRLQKGNRLRCAPLRVHVPPE